MPSQRACRPKVGSQLGFVVGMSEALLSVRDLSVRFPIWSRLLQCVVGLAYAAERVSFDLRANETLGVIGGSGCGKTTAARALIGLARAESGRVVFEGRRTDRAVQRVRAGANREIQMILAIYATVQPGFVITSEASPSFLCAWGCRRAM